MLQLTKEFKEFISADLNKSKVCVELGISRNTLLSRIAMPETFRISEVILLEEISGLQIIEKTEDKPKLILMSN